MSSNRLGRNLEKLEESASTARVLNLRTLHLRMKNNPDYTERPLFKNPSLNRSIILKHRLRPDELDAFPTFRQSATKILLPLEVMDLRMGARYAFIGQRNFNEVLFNVFGIDAASEHPDLRTLAVLDQTPSLDPFLLRELLRMEGIDAAPCYFELSEADMRRMFEFARGEIQQLVTVSLGGIEGAATAAANLSRKILRNAGDKELEPLRLTMQMTPRQYQEGIFCWKAFLYYKWRLRTVLPELSKVLAEIEKIFPRGQIDSESKIYLRSAKDNIRSATLTSCRRITETLQVYDAAYDGLTKQGKPLGFRDFLLRAPALFHELGDRLGGIEHINSFWRYRFPATQLPVITGEELVDIFTDFEQSLAFTPKTVAAA